MANVKTYSKARNGETSLSTNFKVREFACNDGSDTILIDLDLVSFLQKVRNYFGTSLTITSGYRTKSYNSSVGGSPNSYHTKGQAADITVSGIDPAVVAKYAESIGILGIGLYSSYVHIDTRATKYFWKTSGSNSVSTFDATSIIYTPASSSDSNISTIQSTLNSRYGVGLTVDGKYGSMTRGGLIRGLQTEIGATVDGTFGPDTKTKCPTLAAGAKSNAVWILQALLLCNDYNPNGVDGVYGNGTYTAVQRFQSACGLSSDGVAGPNTFEGLCTILPGAQGSISSDSSGDIASIQALLNTKYGASLITDGIYGPLTRTALVRGVQYETGVTVDGIFGPKSKAACPVLQNGSTGNLVYLLQSMLYCSNYNPNGLDGIYGNGTTNAASNFQADYGLVSDGKAGPLTFEALFAGVCTASNGNSSISAVQSWLNIHYGSGLQVDGKYGPLTREALNRALQEEIGVEVDGIFGPITKAACPVLQIGSSGNSVYILQGGLICNKYDPNGFDGKYGNGCYTAVRIFQMNKSLTADGIAGPNTFEGLLSDYTTAGTASGDANSITGISGKTIFIDPGHGGSDPGAVRGSHQEKVYTLKLSQYQKQYFEAKGYTVIMSRTTDATLSLAARSSMANGTNASLFISNHVNASTSASASGVEVYHSINSDTGKQFAKSISSALSAFFSNRGAKTRASSDYPGKDYYHVIRETKMTSMIIEHGFISNVTDTNKLASDSNLKEMARLTVEAVHSLWPQSSGSNPGNTIVPSTPNNNKFFNQLKLIQDTTTEYLRPWLMLALNPTKIVNGYVADFYRYEKYNDMLFHVTAGKISKDYIDYVHKIVVTDIYSPIDPELNIEYDISHMMATLKVNTFSSLAFDEIMNDFGGWIGDLVTLAAQVQAGVGYGLDPYGYTLALLATSNDDMSTFSVKDLISDCDAVNISARFSSNPNITIHDAIHYELEGGGYKNRYNRFLQNRFNNSLNTLESQAYDYLTSDKMSISVPRDALLLVFSGTIVSLTDIAADVAKAFRDFMASRCS